VKAREAERKRAIAEGKMDDPLVPKRLDEAITWYFGPYHKARILSPGGIKRGLFLLKKKLGK